MVICAELNDWILGGMFISPSSNITTPETLIELLENENIEEFSNSVSSWYLAYVLLALYFDFAILTQAGSIAKWFGANVSDSSLVKPLVAVGKSSLKAATSVTREIKHYVKYRNTKEGNFGGKVDGFFGGIAGGINKGWGKLFGGKKES